MRSLRFVLVALVWHLWGCNAADSEPAVTPTPPVASQLSVPSAPSAVSEPSGAEAAPGPPTDAPPSTRATSKPAGPLPLAAALLTHQYYGVYLTGQKAGWAEEEVTARPDGGLRLRTHVRLRIKRLGNEMTMELSDTVDYGPLPAGRLVGFEMVEELPGGAKAVRSGRVDGDALVITVTTGQNTVTRRVSRPRETAHDTLPLLVVRRLRAAGGGPVEMWQFDRQQMRDLPVSTRIMAERKTRLQGVPVTVLEVEGQDKTRGITMTNRLTEGGRTLEMTLGPGLKLVLEDRKLAQDPAVSVPDLYRLSVVPVDRPLGRPDTVTRLRLKLLGLPKAGVSMTDARQTLHGDELEVRRVAAEALPQTALSADDRARWLAATVFIDRKPALQALAEKAAAGATGLGRVAALVHAAHGALRYTLATASMTASDILADGQGDCTEYARLLTAMARAVGIPAREVSGMAYAGDSDPGFAFHAWVEVYVDGRWVAVDPTWDQVTLDATHIALSRDDPSAIVGLLGGLKIQVLSVNGAD